MAPHTTASPAATRTMPAIPTVEPSKAAIGPACPVGQRCREHGEQARLREDGDRGGGPGEDQDAIESMSRRSRGRAGQHDEREHRAAERDGLAREPGGAQPQQHERDHGTSRYHERRPGPKAPARRLFERRAQRTGPDEGASGALDDRAEAA